MGLLSFFGASPETESRVQKGLLDLKMAFPELRQQKMEEDQATSEAEWKKRQREMQEAQYKQQMLDREQALAKQQGIEGAYRGAIESPATQALANGQGPTVGNAQSMLGMKPRINTDKLVSGLLPHDPVSVYQMLQPKPDEMKVVGDALLGIGAGGVKELYRAPQKPDLNSLIVAGPDGKPMLNTMLMDAKKAIAGAGATNVSVGGTKYQDAFDVANAKNFADSFGQINTAGMQAGQTLANLDRMEQLLTGVDGGKFLPAGKEIASMAESFGVRLDPKLGNKEAAEALSVEMALAMRPPGSGPMTDKDFSNFLLTVPGLSKTPAGRSQITATMRAKAMRDEKMADLAQQYVEKNGRLDSGFYKVARDFIASNPVVRRSTSADVRSQADAILGGGK